MNQPRPSVRRTRVVVDFRDPARRVDVALAPVAALRGAAGASVLTDGIADAVVTIAVVGANADLGSLQVVCFDKTGTLTENRMRLEAFQYGNEPASFSRYCRDFKAARRRIDEVSVLCSEIKFETVAGRPPAPDRTAAFPPPP
jgi:hypothetical protein